MAPDWSYAGDFAPTPFLETVMRTLLVRVLRDLREARLASLPTEFEDYGPSADAAKRASAPSAA
jgi:hypothetical protein